MKKDDVESPGQGAGNEKNKKERENQRRAATDLSNDRTVEPPLQAGLGRDRMTDMDDREEMGGGKTWSDTQKL